MSVAATPFKINRGDLRRSEFILINFQPVCLSIDSFQIFEALLANPWQRLHAIIRHINIEGLAKAQDIAPRLWLQHKQMEIV